MTNLDNCIGQATITILASRGTRSFRVWFGVSSMDRIESILGTSSGQYPLAIQTLCLIQTSPRFRCQIITTWAGLDQFLARRGNHHGHNILVFLFLCLKFKILWSLRYLDSQIGASESSIKQVKIPSTFLSSGNNTTISSRFRDQTISSFLQFLYYYLWSVFHFNHTIWSHQFTYSLSFFLSSLRQLQLRTPRLTSRNSKSETEETAEMVAEMEEAVIETNARSGEAIRTTSTLAIRVPRLPFPKSVLLSHPPAGTSKFIRYHHDTQGLMRFI